MSFADELRAFNKDDEISKQNHTRLKQDVQQYIDLLKRACTEANSKNRKSVSIYFIRWCDDGYEETRYIETLPSVQQEVEESKRFNKARYTTHSRFNSADAGKFEDRLYGALICFQPDYANRLLQLLNNELSKLGFSTYKACLIELDDIYVIHNRKANVFSGTVSESLSTRVAGKLYTINLQATW